jgi:hypothetical protein
MRLLKSIAGATNSGREKEMEPEPISAFIIKIIKFTRITAIINNAKLALRALPFEEIGMPVLAGVPVSGGLASGVNEVHLVFSGYRAFMLLQFESEGDSGNIWPIRKIA